MKMQPASSYTSPNAVNIFKGLFHVKHKKPRRAISTTNAASLNVSRETQARPPSALYSRVCVVSRETSIINIDICRQPTDVPVSRENSCVRFSPFLLPRADGYRKKSQKIRKILLQNRTFNGIMSTTYEDGKRDDAVRHKKTCPSTRAKIKQKGALKPWAGSLHLPIKKAAWEKRPAL